MRRIAITASMLSLLAGGALAQSGPPTKPWDLRKAQAFSNICLSQETGDARGLRVFLQAPGAKPLVVTQVAEGAPMAPQAASGASVTGTAVSFTTAGGETFRGTLSDKALTLSSKRVAKLVLHRRSDAKGFPVCTGAEGQS
ncbi:hypothetical protein JKL49_09445 [Phenylobacterium sp. 20VBR1]|uniref:Uncharacterized protein n=1 Tax=Phenylobacterium glaciei TaxID=2803784 RepID=A0A941CZQ8_9CAUL|nr:hypothetical protein [Phenylobacterium glaciei]MBR7619610.1 hypothetical protein [Phenylobacterium glaciei]